MTKRAIVFLWDNFGPMHTDRCNDVARTFGDQANVIGIELFGRSDTYDWTDETARHFELVTLFPEGSWSRQDPVGLAWAIFRAVIRTGARDVFLCHYERPAIFMVAIALRAFGRRVFTMGCSKFDDYERMLWRELLKCVAFLPYSGALSSGVRSKDYVRFLGIPADRIKGEYNTLSVQRIRDLAGLPPGPGGVDFEARHFTIVARFVPKKNLIMALDAYALYRQSASKPRQLHLCGSGPLEPDLRRRTTELGLDDFVVFRGFLQSKDIARALANTLALLLPSVEEQFGNVVIEALAMGVPIIASTNCGACDRLVQNAMDGFVVESENMDGFAYFMRLISEEVTVWQRMSVSATEMSSGGDSDKFSAGVVALANLTA